MKLWFFILLMLSVCFPVFAQAQAPTAFSYQAIARDTSGRPLINRPVALQVAILRGSTTGTKVYEEIHDDLLTNGFGIFVAQIGRGMPQVGTLGQIDWGNGPYFLEVGIDPENGNDFDLASVTEILSVPYALYAERAKETDGDPTNELQQLNLSGNTLSLSNGGGSVNLPSGGTTYTAGPGIGIANNTISNTGDTDANNDITNTTPAGGALTGIYPNPQIANNAITSSQIQDGSVTLNDLAIGVVPQSLNDLSDVEVTGVTNGQVLKWNGTAWVAGTDNTGTGGGGSGTATAPLVGDGTAANPFTLGQNGAQNGQILKWNGTAWVAANDNLGPNYTAGAGITILGTVVSATDVSATNELQNLTLNGNTLALSNSTPPSVNLAPFMQSLTYNSTTQTLQISGGNSVQLTGGGSGDPNWTKTGTVLQPTEQSNSVNIPSGQLSGGGNTGWNMSLVQGAANMQLRKANGTGSNVIIGGVAGEPNKGAISLYNTNNTQVVYHHTCSHNAGETWVQSPTGKINVDLGHSWNAEEGRIDVLGTTYTANGGVLRLYSDNNTGKFELLDNEDHLLVEADRSGLDSVDGGALRIYSNNTAVARLYSEHGYGNLLLTNKGETLATAGRAYNNKGEFIAWAPGERAQGVLSVCDHDAGLLELNSPNNNSLVIIGHTDAASTENGYIGINNKNHPTGGAVTGFWSTDEDGIVFSDAVETEDAFFFKNNSNQWHTSLIDEPNGGWLRMYDNGGAPVVNVYVDGQNKGIVDADEIVGGIKNFKMPHPTQPGKDIFYACVEGPEAAAYTRGSGQLVNGAVFIPFPEHFSLIIDPSSITVQLTVNHTDTYGLAAMEKTATGFWVRELKGGTGNFTFDWEAKAVRKGYENYQVVRPHDTRLDQAPTPKASARTAPRKGHAHEQHNRRRSQPETPNK